MNANMKKWMTVGAVVAAMIVALSGGNVEAKKDTEIPSGACNQCAQTLRSGNIVCNLTSCQAGCQYVCHDEGSGYDD